MRAGGLGGRDQGSLIVVVNGLMMVRFSMVWPLWRSSEIRKITACLPGGGDDQGIPPGDVYTILDQPGLFERGRSQIQQLPALKVTDVGTRILDGHPWLQAAGDCLVVLLEHLCADSPVP